MNKIVSYLLSPYIDVNSKRSTKGDNLEILDGIRGFAVLIVLASHTSAFFMYAQGSLGVFLFFFLSGIVLSIPYISSSKILDIKETSLYFVNRVCRIVPLYVVMVAIYQFFTIKTLNGFGGT